MDGQSWLNWFQSTRWWWLGLYTNYARCICFVFVNICPICGKNTTRQLLPKCFHSDYILASARHNGNVNIRKLSAFRCDLQRGTLTLLALYRRFFTCIHKCIAESFLFGLKEMLLCVVHVRYYSRKGSFFILNLIINIRYKIYAN